MMSVALLSGDLMTISQVAGAGARSAMPLATFAGAGALLESAGRDSPRVVIVDLAAPGLDIGSLVAGLRAAGGRTTIVAFGAHVQADRLAAARAAGCDRVLTRGQFFADIEKTLRLAADEAGG